MSIHRAIAARLPDLPSLVEVRALLLAGEGEVLSLEHDVEIALVLHDPEARCVFLVGETSDLAFDTALAAIRSGQTEVVAPLSFRGRLSAALPGWSHAPLIVHTLGQPERLPGDPAHQVGWVAVDALESFGLPAELLEELQDGGSESPIATVRVAGRPVAFCYAGSQTETLWDIAVDTLEPHRRNGYAALCVAHMIRHMRAQGKLPVWQALEDNPASWRLAAKLGFAPIDTLVMFEAPQD